VLRRSVRSVDRSVPTPSLILDTAAFGTDDVLIPTRSLPGRVPGSVSERDQQYPLIDRPRRRRLAKLIRKGEEEALDKLVRSNLRFVVSVAKKYQNQGVPLSDLINEGNLGLIRAAHKFDETKGIKFISYAVWWIRQAILQALAEQSRIVRVPLNRAGALHRIGRRSSNLLQELGREPTVEEIAEELDVSEEEVERTLAISQSHLSLDAPITPGEDNRLLDYLPDQYSPGRRTRRTSTPSSHHRGGARHPQGAGGQDPPVLLRPGRPGADDAGGDRLDLGITRERVRQIKEKALVRLRHASRARFLETFIRRLLRAPSPRPLPPPPAGPARTPRALTPPPPSGVHSWLHSKALRPNLSGMKNLHTQSRGRRAPLVARGREGQAARTARHRGRARPARQAQADLHPHLDTGDHVVVINARRCADREEGRDQKTYFRHSGYMGARSTFPSSA
jgi:RNA polymerase primary sigma factor